MTRSLLSALLLCFVLCRAAEWSALDTDTLLQMRGEIQEPEERRILNAELQRRMPTMEDEQLERYLSPPDKSVRLGAGDGRIATH